ncbi:MAG TPA: rhodanese-like domain-containing protein [Puia sp.]|nr:rhodanese-like domain-containing protein [Puia sp.]
MTFITEKMVQAYDFWVEIKMQYMTSIFSRLFGKSVNLRSIHQHGAVIVDVRSPKEFSGGHIDGALNIPLDQLSKYIGELQQKGKPVITCCLSGGRSASATNLLSQAGLEVYNGGGWSSLERTLR